MILIEVILMIYQHFTWKSSPPNKFRSVRPTIENTQLTYPTTKYWAKLNIICRKQLFFFPVFFETGVLNSNYSKAEKMKLKNFNEKRNCIGTPLLYLPIHTLKQIHTHPTHCCFFRTNVLECLQSWLTNSKVKASAIYVHVIIMLSPGRV